MLKKGNSCFDQFRLIAAVLVIAIHTFPLMTYSVLGDFWLTRVASRIAVPYFFMLTGHFVLKKSWKEILRFVKRTCLLYAVAVLLYLPVNIYSGGLTPLTFLYKLVIEGTLYHLWYFPALILGVIIAKALYGLDKRAALPIAVLLFLIGLGGDSYYGLIRHVPFLDVVYKGIFSVFTYTRNGLFLAPLFLLMGAWAVGFKRKISAAGFIAAMAAMSIEGLVLHNLDVQRHDSMYLLLPLVMIFLFSFLMAGNAGKNLFIRNISSIMYIIHPLVIILVRGFAKVVHIESLLIENSLIHFAAVVIISILAAALISVFLPRSLHKDIRAWREIDLSALSHNTRILEKSLPPDCRLMAVVKANAYGHGDTLVSRKLQRQGVKTFAVATIREAVKLRKSGIRGTILILGYTSPKEAANLFYWRLTQTVVNEEHGFALASQGYRLHVHLALDTGMHRLGILAGDYAAILRIFQLKQLKIDGTFSHLAVSDSLSEDDISYTQYQLKYFYHTVGWMKKNGCPPGKIHIQASYGLWNLPAQPCDYARIGIALYGVGSDNHSVINKLNLKPVLSLRSRVTCVRTLKAGGQAGYGLCFTAQRESLLAIVSIGYADGLPRNLAELGAQVLIRGKFCPVVGRVCMDQLFVDVTQVPDAEQGDIVTLIGRDGTAEIRAEDLAEQSHTITNELLSRLGGRLELRN